MLDDFHGTPSGSAMRIRLGERHQIANQPPLSIGSRNRFMVNSIFCDSKYSAASFLAAVRSLVNFSRMNGSRGMALLKRGNGGQAIDLWRGQRKWPQRDGTR